MIDDKTWHKLANEVFKWFPLDSMDIGNSEHERVLEITNIYPDVEYLEISEYFDELTSYFYNKRKQTYDEFAREAIIRDTIF